MWIRMGCHRVSKLEVRNDMLHATGQQLKKMQLLLSDWPFSLSCKKDQDVMQAAKQCAAVLPPEAVTQLDAGAIMYTNA
jgi:hypothetical protein